MKITIEIPVKKDDKYCGECPCLCLPFDDTDPQRCAAFGDNLKYKAEVHGIFEGDHIRCKHCIDAGSEEETKMLNSNDVKEFKKCTDAFLRAVAASAEVAGMQAENADRKSLSQNPAYTEKAFMAVLEKYEIGK